MKHHRLAATALGGVVVFCAYTLCAPGAVPGQPLPVPTAPAAQQAAQPAAAFSPEDADPLTLFEAQEAATPAPTPATAATPPPGAGSILAVQYTQGSGPGYLPCGPASLKNSTALADSEVADILAQGLPFSVQPGSTEPQVLILHTHATECYEMSGGSWYDPAATGRTTNTEQSVVAVGAEMARVLNERGICTVHSTRLHDYPSYNGSYAKSNATAQEYLAQYPSIQIILDVHRDAIEQPDGMRVKPLATLDGQDTAQVMLICGCDQGGNLPNYTQNLRFAAAWQAAMEGLSPGLTRPLLFDYRYYNQDLAPGALLIEVGGHANTLEEAKRAGVLAAEALAQLLGA